MRRNLLTPFLLAGWLAGISTVAGQGDYTWSSTGLTMQLPYDTASAEIVEEPDELRISWNNLELQFLAIEKDSIVRYFTKPYEELLMELIREFGLIQLTGPAPFASTPEGVWLTAKDTAIFTDTTVMGALSWPGSDMLVIAVFDCFGAPLPRATTIMKSLAFLQNTEQNRKRDD